MKANVLFFDKKTPRADGKPHTTKVWVYDLRTAKHFTLKQRPLTRADLEEFVQAYGEKRADRVDTSAEEAGRFKAYTYDELVKRDKVNLDLTWMKDPALEDADSLLPPEVIAAEIVQDLQAALSEFAAIAEALGGEVPADAEPE